MAALPQPGVAPSRPDTSTNDVLRRLPGESRARLLSAATRVSTRRDQVLFDGTADLLWTYLLYTGLVSLQTLTEGGNAVEIAMIGREGLIGFVPRTLPSRPSYHAEVTIPGEMMRVRTDVLLAEFDRVTATRQILLTSWSVLLDEIAQNSACHRFHPARQRLARWLLEAADRTGITRFHLTQEDLGQRLGLQRTGITLAMFALQDAGAIRVRYGRIAILDRSRLELKACECYRLIRPSNRSASPY